MLKTSTYFALPRLKSYQDALAHHNNVTPIRGDKDGTKPAGRRDQKFFAIWQRAEDKAISIGYHWHKDKPLMTFYPDGQVGIKTHMSASCRERVERILGVCLQRKHNRTWLQAKTYQDGEEVRGWFPISDPKDNWQAPHREALLMLHALTVPTFLNPIPVETHTKDRQASKAITAKYKAFRSYVENIAKLTDGWVPAMPTQELRALLGLSLDGDHANRDPHLCPQYSYAGIERHAKYRALFFELLERGTTEDMYKAMLWVSASTGGYWGRDSDRRHLDLWWLSWERTVNIHYRDMLFSKTQSRDGVIRPDRYGRFFRAI